LSWHLAAARTNRAPQRCGAGRISGGTVDCARILLPDWKRLYGELIERLADELIEKVRHNGFIEIILMTYSFVQNAINTEAFSNAVQLSRPQTMTGRGRGKYCYRNDIRAEPRPFAGKAVAALPYDENLIYFMSCEFLFITHTNKVFVLSQIVFLWL
jgi:hypothetical protein